MTDSAPKVDDIGRLEEPFNCLYDWIKLNSNELSYYDRIPSFHFEVYDHPLIQKCKGNESYTRFVDEIKKHYNISKKINTSIWFFGTKIELKEDYIMYQLIHEILEENTSRVNILKSFLTFFTLQSYSLEFKYSIQNFSFESLSLFSDKHLDINFEKNGEQYYIYILMKANLWSSGNESTSKFYDQNIIDKLSICLELLTFNRIHFNLVKINPSSLITLFPDSNAVESQYMGNEIINLDPNIIEKLKSFCKIFANEYDNNYHSLNLFHSARGLFYSNDDQFLYLIYCLESLLGMGGTDSLSFKISYRTSKLVTSDRSQQIEVREYVKSFYKDRSKFVHNGISNFETAKTERLRKYVIMVLRNRILINRYKTDFDIGFSFKDYNHNLENKDIRLKEIEAIIDYFEPLTHPIIDSYNNSS